jgi:hypothetical protein
MMSLQNLFRIGRIKEHPVDAAIGAAIIEYQGDKEVYLSCVNSLTCSWLLVFYILESRIKNTHDTKTTRHIGCAQTARHRKA